MDPRGRRVSHPPLDGFLGWERSRREILFPRGSIASCNPHWDVIFVLLYRINLSRMNYKVLADHIKPLSDAYAWKRQCVVLDEVKVTVDWWLTLSPVGVTSRGRELFMRSLRRCTTLPHDLLLLNCDTQSKTSFLSHVSVPTNLGGINVEVIFFMLVTLCFLLVTYHC